MPHNDHVTIKAEVHEGFVSKLIANERDSASILYSNYWEHMELKKIYFDKNDTTIAWFNNPSFKLAHYIFLNVDLVGKVVKTEFL